MKRLLYCLMAALLVAGLSFSPPSSPARAEALFSDKDLTVTTAQDAAAITLSGESVTIDTEGVYVLSGAIDNGSLRIVLAEEGTVRLLLNGVTIHNDTGAALYTENCKKVVITLGDGTTNTLSQGNTGIEDEPGAITSRDDLTINGSGALTVASGYKDGVNCRDTFKMVSGALTVNAADDGIVGKDAVIIGGGTLNVTAVNDGVKATNEEEAERGYVTLAGGDVTITTTGEATAASSGTAAGEAALASAPPLNGETPPDGMTPPDETALPDASALSSAAAAPDTATGAAQPGKGGRGGGRGGMGGRDGASAESSQTTLASSAKGVKAVTTLTVSGANLTLNTADDCLHAADVVISKGYLTLASGDDGVHADNSLLVSGGTVSITRAYEGLEAASLTISGGDITVIASDDGVNGAGGDAGEQTDSGWGSKGFGGFDRFSSSTGELCISGGTLRITAQGDGIDVNGSIVMTGGEVYVNGPSSSGNGALDYDGSFSISGGTLVALGARGMAMGVSAAAVPGVSVALSGTAGTLAVKADNGDALLSMEASASYESAVIYSDRLIDGGSYTLVTPNGEQAVTVSTAATSGLGGR